MIRITATQIPQYWEIIKFTVKNSGYYSEVGLKECFNDLLYDLLNNKAQCFIKLNDKREIKALHVTRVLYDKNHQVKYLQLNGMFAWETSTPAEWVDDAKTVEAFAIAEGCAYISFDTNVEKIANAGIANGYKLAHSTFVFYLKD